MHTLSLYMVPVSAPSDKLQPNAGIREAVLHKQPSSGWLLRHCVLRYVVEILYSIIHVSATLKVLGVELNVVQALQ